MYASSPTLAAAWGGTAIRGYEQEVCREVSAHPDAAEGPRAFMEMREPRFSDQ